MDINFSFNHTLALWWSVTRSDYCRNVLFFCCVIFNSIMGGEWHKVEYCAYPFMDQLLGSSQHALHFTPFLFRPFLNFTLHCSILWAHFFSLSFPFPT